MKLRFVPGVNTKEDIVNTNTCYWSVYDVRDETVGIVTFRKTHKPYFNASFDPSGYSIYAEEAEEIAKFLKEISEKGFGALEEAT